MLYKEAANANTWRVLEKLMELDFLSDFHLCGGTSLALLYGHRLSVDIDLFTAKSFDKTTLDMNLRDHFEEVNEVFTEVKIFYFTYLDKVKSDFVYSKPEVISDFVNKDGIRMWGLPDIMAMKLNAIYGRGSKKTFGILTNY